MDSQVLNLLLETLRLHGQKLDAISTDVTTVKTTLEVGQHETRLQKVEAVAWYAKVIVGTVGFVGTAGGVAKLFGIL